MQNKEVRDLDQEQMQRANGNNVILDKIKDMLRLKNDAAIARTLEVAPPVISKLRYGILPFGSNYIIRTHELTGLPISEIKALAGRKAMESLQVAA